MFQSLRNFILKYHVLVGFFILLLILSGRFFPGINDIKPESSGTDSSVDLHTSQPISQPQILEEVVYLSPSVPELIISASLTPSPTIEFPTPSVTLTPVPITRFAVIGDYGLAGVPESDVAYLVIHWDPDFIITTGDNNYPDGSAATIDENIGQYFHEYIHPYIGQYGSGAEINRFFPTLGNHDWNTDNAEAYFEYFSLPGNERYYDIIWGSVHLFAIDSDSREPDGVGMSSVQAMWLKEKLANSTAPWKIVFMHQPPYASAGDGSIAWAQWPYKQWGASAVLCGHSHVYERIIIDDFLYFVNGLGGGPIYKFDVPISGSLIRYNKDYGAMFIEATQEKITFTFLTRGNILVDSYTIEK